MPVFEPAVDVAVDHDPLRWLRGPDVDTPEEQRERWVAEALSTYDEAFDLGTREHAEQLRDYLRRLFTGFAGWDSPAQMRFLRFREPADTAIPVGVEFYGPQQLEDIRVQFPDEDFATGVLEPPVERGLVGETSVEEVEEAPGWQRLFYSVRGGDGEVHSFVRYVRMFEDAGVLVVFRFGGDSPAVMVEAIPDADALAACISVTPTGDR